MPEKQIYRGLCYGGPLDGLVFESRFPEGFILVDRSAGKACLYLWCKCMPAPDGPHFLLDYEKGVMTLDEEKHWETAEGPRFDVRAMPDGVSW